MNNLERAAQGVLDNWEHGDLAGAVRALDEALKEAQALPKNIRLLHEHAAEMYELLGATMLDLSDLMRHGSDSNRKQAKAAWKACNDFYKKIKSKSDA